MPAVLPPASRRPLHRRALDVQVFAREDGLFEKYAEKRNQIIKTNKAIKKIK